MGWKNGNTRWTRNEGEGREGGLSETALSKPASIDDRVPYNNSNTVPYARWNTKATDPATDTRPHCENHRCILRDKWMLAPRDLKNWGL
jgi:hypothetical protein